MCGICGVVDWGEVPEAEKLVRRMTPTMLHRGPDDEGYLVSEGPAQGRLAIGMRRLSVIDLEGGHQPIFNEDARVGAVLNGEIYNFCELRQRLEDRGHRFRSRSDSEVVAHAYEEWGANCVDYLEGMFALAVYDRRPQSAFERLSASNGNGKLFLARDRLGIKPLYYFAEMKSPGVNHEQALGRFVFASEVRTLLASGVTPRAISPSALESYLLFGSVSEPMTLVDGVLSLPPGHRMTIELGASTCVPKPERYWTITTSSRSKNGAGVSHHSSANGHAARFNFKSAAVRVRELLAQSIRRHLVADVPSGIFLSSGIDSTSLAALASAEISGIHTFTVSFPDEEFCEATIARQTALRLGTTHQEVRLTGEAMLNRIDQAVSALDQPSMDGINTYFVSQAAREAGLKVALSGLGGDEVFGGYKTFRRTPALHLIGAVGGRLPVRVRGAMATAATIATGSRTRGDVVRKLTALWSDSQSLPHPYFFGRALFTPPQVAGLLRETKSRNGDALWWHWLEESAAQASALDAFSAVTCMETQSYLVNTLLRDTDSMSMAHSLEVRVPFLDHRLVKFVTGLPRQVKLRQGRTKALLVAALKDLLPPEVVHQPKRGFTFPWNTWLRGPLKEKLDRGFAEFSPALAEYLSLEDARGVWRSYLVGNTSWSRPWSLYVLNEWVKRLF